MIQIAPRVGLEPTTTRLTAECSTIELSRKISMALQSKDIRFAELPENYIFHSDETLSN